jgi:hypothetical protein
MLKAPALPLLQETLDEPETMTDQQEANEPMRPMRRKAGSSLKNAAGVCAATSPPSRPEVCHMTDVSLSEEAVKERFLGLGVGASH